MRLATKKLATVRVKKVVASNMLWQKQEARTTGELESHNKRKDNNKLLGKKLQSRLSHEARNSKLAFRLWRLLGPGAGGVGGGFAKQVMLMKPQEAQQGPKKDETASGWYQEPGLLRLS